MTTSKVRFALVAVGVALLLGACSVTVFIGSLTDKTVTTVTSNEDVLANAPVADTFTLGPSEERIYRVNIASSADAGIFLYTDRSIALYAYDANGNIYASSNVSTFFAERYGGIGTSSQDAELAPSAIDFAVVCPGSCVLAPNDGGDVRFVRIRNTGGSDVTYRFWATTRSFEDSNETASAPPIIPSDGDAQGALETLGDNDRFEVGVNGYLTIFGVLASGIEYVAEITDPLDPGQPPHRIYPGDSPYPVEAFEEVRVFALNSPDRAAAAGDSTYTLSHSTTP